MTVIWNGYMMIYPFQIAPCWLPYSNAPLEGELDPRIMLPHNSGIPFFIPMKESGKDLLLWILTGAAITQAKGLPSCLKIQKRSLSIVNYSYFYVI